MLALTGALQSTVAAHVSVLGVCPNLVLLLTVSCTLLMGTRSGVIAALAGGLVLDALSGAPFGISVIALVVVALITGVGEMNLFGSIRLLPFLAAALGTAIYHLVMLFLMGLGGDGLPWGPTMWRVGAPAMLVNTATMLLVHGASAWVYGRVRPRRVEWT
ncbi:MAG: rod shape-determining protein MreD [Chloroflexi bacterium]|nr:rod shape-determining protein MreD [Chloroflexota bacterium]